MVHELMAENSVDQKPKHNESKNSLSHSLRNHVPHLIVKHVNLLHPLKIVDSHRSVCYCPHSQVVHMRQQGPVMSEGDLLALFEEVVFILSLPIVPREFAEVSEVLSA